MNLEQSAHQEISDWFNSSMNYTEGVILYSKYGKNPSLKKIFPGKESRYARKLAYELGKIIGINHVIPLIESKTVEKVIPIEPLPQPDNVQKDSIPDIMAKIIKRMQKVYTDRSLLHKKLKAVPPDNRCDNVQTRKEIVEKMSKLSDEMDSLSEHKSNYQINGILPDPIKLFGKPSDNKPAPVDYNKAGKRRFTLQKSISKDRLLLDYQKPKKQAEKNPMPTGPKRTLIEQRIKKKLAEIKELDKILNHDPGKNC